MCTSDPSPKFHIDGDPVTRAVASIDALLGNTITNRPNCLAHAYAYGCLERACGRPSRAIEHFKRAIEGVPPASAVFVYYQLAQCYFETHAYDDALAMYECLLQYIPTNADAYFGYAQAFHAKGQSIAAEALYQHTMTIARQNSSWMVYANAFAELSAIYDELGWYDRGVELCQQALQSDFTHPSQPDPVLLTNLGGFHLKLEDAHEGLRVLEEAIRIDEGYAPAHMNLAIAYSMLAKSHQGGGGGETSSMEDYDSNTNRDWLLEKASEHLERARNLAPDLIHFQLHDILASIHEDESPPGT